MTTTTKFLKFHYLFSDITAIFHFLMLQVNFITFIDLFIVSTSFQGDRGRKSPATSLQGDRGKAPTVP